MIGAKPLRISFYKVDRVIRVYDATRYLVLFGPEKYDALSDRIRYLRGQKSCIVYVISHNYARVKIGSDEILPLERILTLHNVIILIKSAFAKDQNHSYCNKFLQKCSYK